MKLLYKTLLVAASLSLLIPLSGAVVYLPIPGAAASSIGNPITDILPASVAIIGTLVLGKILQGVLRMGQKLKKGVVEGAK